MKIYRDADADLSVLTDRTVAILGYGNQGHAHALNLRDSGCSVIVGAREGSPSGAQARAVGFTVLSYAEAAAQAGIAMMTLPDEHIPAIYRDHVVQHLPPGSALGFAHGLAVHFGHLEPRGDLDVFLIGPKGAGRWLRAEYEAGRGLACLMAVDRDVTGQAGAVVLAYAAALGCGRAGILETTFADECETDLFGEQAVLCGGIPDLIQAGYETLVEAGYDPDLAYFECVHEAKLIVDLIFERGLKGMRKAISNTAEYGGFRAGRRLVTGDTRAEMRTILADIRSGRFADRLIADTRGGAPELSAFRERQDDQIESAGQRVRALIPWLSEKG